MRETLLIIQIVSAVILIGLILLQVKGVGFGRVWGSWTTSFSRRGLEGFVFKSTFVVAFIFILVSTLELVI